MRDDVVVAGVGMHPFGRFDGIAPAQMGRIAVTRALADAGLAWRDVDAAYVASMYLPATAGARTLKPLGATGIPICDVEAACAVPLARPDSINHLSAWLWESLWDWLSLKFVSA